ncbi:GL25804 [Drosophila persimilis]|uniref:GL25804 n=1 Tax=Drosophila persimilis TaxID=7234 RepID=B4GJT9_DROPE|nr:uncharacterized protein LOC6593789 [Drosophila persimilis]EDW36905.1 GL25804 [Drosophila persimilis]
MKAALVFLFLALFVAAVYGASDCDPDGNGKPACQSGNIGERFRNNWDPTRYWLCAEAGEPQVVLCEQTGYDPVSKECVAWSQWSWYPPCP